MYRFKLYPIGAAHNVVIAHLIIPRQVAKMSRAIYTQL